jgi:hypothetical protein
MIDIKGKIGYNLNCSDEQNTGRFVFTNAANHNIIIVGKAPLVCGLYVPLFV